MYITKHYQMADFAECIDFMQKYSFACIVSSHQNSLIASHLPFVAKIVGEDLMLYSHFAKANPQSQGIENQEVMVVFQEPHAYISPKNYEKIQNVPTWNYLAVHAYGEVKIVHETSQSFQILEEMIHSYESDYYAQWQQLPDDYKNKMVQGITAFEMRILRLEGKKKLSQNKTETEQLNIIKNLKTSKDTQAQTIAQYMTENQTKAIN